MKIKPSRKKGSVVLEVGRKDERMLATSSALRIQEILVPIDFSETSLKALRYAAPFATQFGARIKLLHVLEPLMIPSEVGYVPAEILEGEQQAAKSAMEKLAKLCQDELPARCLSQASVRVGVAWNEIVLAAKQTQADLIIVATHGRTGLKHVLLGSVAERVVRHAPCPVFVVRDQEREIIPAASLASKTRQK